MAEGTRAGDSGEVGKPIFSFTDDNPETGTGGRGAGAGSGTINPETIAGSDNSGPGSGRKQRSDKGQPRGSRKSSASTQKAPLDLGFIELLLTSIHVGVASFVHMPEMELTPEEVHRFALSAQNVAQYYDIPVSPKTQAWLALGTVAVQIYGTRLAANALKPAETKPAPQSIFNGNLRPVS